jgi:phenylpyruvate tautomerase PptA (4-oxalocrotonate tautomerase family)
MPFVRVDTIEGRSPEQIKGLLDTIHRTLIATLKIPLRDRYQVVHEHPASHFIAEDTGLGITRTRNCVFIQLTTRRHPREAKENCYRELSRNLEKECGVAPSDIIVSIVTNADEDWSFGYGRAEYLTGELAA